MFYRKWTNLGKNLPLGWADNCQSMDNGDLIDLRIDHIPDIATTWCLEGILKNLSANESMGIYDVYFCGALYYTIC